MHFVCALRNSMVKIEIAYVAQNQAYFYQILELPVNTTVEQALELSDIYCNFPETKTLTVGIFAKAVSRTQLLVTGDRIELYRPLTLNPKDRRKLLSKSSKKA
ncbi:MAG: RnfH family protein [Legionellaceae bacterium]|nr:RnfH family protein [Legionellaceae bacterium]HCA89551.1 RnfH family protein [Legionellales bacterium]